MTKYTTTSLIKELENFPKDTVIRADLAFIFNYDEDIISPKSSNETDDDFLERCKKVATDVAIFEGDWKKDNISDLENIMPEYVEGWESDDKKNKIKKILQKKYDQSKEDYERAVKAGMPSSILYDEMEIYEELANELGVDLNE